MSNRITKGEALVGALRADDDLTVGDDAGVTGDLTAGTLAVGSSGSVIKKMASATASVNLPNITAATTGSATFTLTGAAAGDVVIVNPPALTAGLAFVGATVTAADTVTVYAANVTAAAIDNAAATFTYLWVDLT
jgi:hypothetical protein